MILAEAFRYITELKRQNDEMLLNGGDEVQGEPYHSNKTFVDAFTFDLFLLGIMFLSRNVLL